MSRVQAAWALLALGAALLLFRLGRPALWQDEAETALRAESVLETGAPRMKVRGVLATAQPSLSASEGTPSGLWIWNTWLPAYLAAASIAVLGKTPFAARLPFALAGLLALWLAWRLFTDGEKDELDGRRPWGPEAGLALLALSPAYALFARQSRYYALGALGAALLLTAWRAAILERPRARLWTALALQVMLHSSFALFGIGALALAADAALRRSRRLAGAVVLGALLAAPAIVFFRAWDRPGNHLYPAVESLEFLKTFILWLSLFTLPSLLPAAAALKSRRPLAALAGFVLLCGLVGEGLPSRLAALAAAAWIAWTAATAPPGLRRLCWLLVASTLLLLSPSAAEPYGRYLTPALPALAYLGGRWLSELGGGRGPAVAALAAAALACNLAGWLPLKAAALAGGPREPALTVSGMMRQRLRDAAPRSDLARLAGELVRGPEGYVEAAAAEIRARGGRTAFSDADALSLMAAAGVEPVYPSELGAKRPDWLLLSPWLRLDPLLDARVRGLAGSPEYAPAGVEAPRLLWQNNPDPLFRDFSPRRGPLALFRRVSAARRAE